MLTWVSFWWFCLLPLPAVFLVGALPSISILGGVFHGGLVREWFLNHAALPLLNEAAGWKLVSWFEQASYVEELMFQALMAFDVTLLLMPLMYLIGEIIIRVSAWLKTTQHSQRNQFIR